MGLDSYPQYVSSMQQHSPDFYHYSPPSLHDYTVPPIKQEAAPLLAGPQPADSDHSEDSVSQLSSPAYTEPQHQSDMKSISDVLKSTYGTWDRVREQLWIERDPRLWSRDHVAQWLSWAIREFSLGSGAHIDSFISSLSMCGKELCAMNKQDFITRSPMFMGDILWAHLEILQKEVDKENAKVENVPVNFSEPFSVPDQFQRTYTTLGTATPTSLPAPPPPSTLSASNLPPSLPHYTRLVSPH